MTQKTEDTFEQNLLLFKELPLIDLRGTTFIDPYGMVGLLEMGELLKSEDTQKTLYLPGSIDVLKYLERMDFFKFADRYFRPEPLKPEISERSSRSLYSDVLLEITSIEKSKNKDKSVIARKLLEYGWEFQLFHKIMMAFSAIKMTGSFYLLMLCY